MPHRFRTTTALFFTLTLTLAAGCNFDPSTANDGVDPEKLDDSTSESDDSLNPKPPGEESELLYHPSSERTRRGLIVAGDYLELSEMDTSIEKLLGQVGDQGEQLDQRWELENVPAGQYEMTLVAKAFSPIDVERYQVSYRMSGSPDWIEIFRLSSGTVLTSHVYRVDVPSLGDLEFRMSLFDDAPIVEEAGDGIGFNIWPGAGNNGNGGGVEVQQAYRTLSVDYLGLRLTKAL